jgi:hypothetical protein
VRHPLIPIGAVVAIGWIVALLLAVRGRSGRAHLDELDALATRMCDCSTLACLEEVEREVAELGRPDAGDVDQLELYAAEQTLKKCKREVMRKELQ